MEEILEKTQENLEKSLEVLRQELTTLRSSRPSPALVENLHLKVYGGTTELTLKELATINAVDAQTLVIEPFDQTIIEEITSGLEKANLKTSLVVDESLIRLTFPPLSLERRQEMVKLMGQYLEGARIAIRQIRQKTKEAIEKAFKNKQIPEDEKFRLEKLLQKKVDDANEEIKALGDQKEKELLAI